tara:strand:+ start:329 stop:466 length:138 start_codon:yes stop_codon:yes gene_type:complete
MEALETAGVAVEVVAVLVPAGLAIQVGMRVELLEEMVEQDQRVVE